MWRGWDTFHRGDLFPVFKETEEGQGALQALATCQITLIQSKQHAIVGYFGVVCLGL